MRIFSLNALLLVILFSSCHRAEKSEVSGEKDVVVLPKDKIEVSVTTPEQYKNDYMTLGTLFHQAAAEYRALCYQAYNLGKILIDKDLADKSIDKHRIVVLDIDETVLDNSPYQAECIINDINYPTRWEEWCGKASAIAVPGSLDFLTYARANGISVYYITNRKQHLKDVTIQNLVNLGCPMADDDHVIMRTDDDSKEGRRNKLLEKYHISVLCGDNLSDFSFVFDDKSNEARAAEVDRMQKAFGQKFVVLPNSMYGDWEIEIYKKDKTQSDSVKSMLRIKALKGF